MHTDTKIYQTFHSMQNIGNGIKQIQFNMNIHTINAQNNLLLSTISERNQ